MMDDFNFDQFKWYTSNGLEIANKSANYLFSESKDLLSKSYDYMQPIMYNAANETVHFLDNALTVSNAHQLATNYLYPCGRFFVAHSTGMAITAAKCGIIGTAIVASSMWPTLFIAHAMPCGLFTGLESAANLAYFNMAFFGITHAITGAACYALGTHHDPLEDGILNSLISWSNKLVNFGSIFVIHDYALDAACIILRVGSQIITSTPPLNIIIGNITPAHYVANALDIVEWSIYNSATATESAALALNSTIADAIYYIEHGGNIDSIHIASSDDISSLQSNLDVIDNIDISPAA